LDLANNNLKGTIPSQIALMSNLCEPSVVWLLVGMIVLSCVFFILLSCLLVIIHSTAGLYLSGNSLTGTIPSEVGLMSNLGESSVVWLLVVMIVLSCVFFIVLSCFLVIFHSTAGLYLSGNSLRGTIPSQIALMSNLGESSVVWLLVALIVLCVFHCCLSFFHSTDWLYLYDNNFTGEFTCPDFIGDCWISCDHDYNCWISFDVETDTYTQACRSL
jgi:hypothetical protein